MNILDRLATLVRADAHGVVDAVEDKQLLLKQHLRQAEAELIRKQARTEALEVESCAVADEMQRSQARIAQLDQDISLAMTDNADDLARFSIKRLLPLRQRCLELDERQKEILAEQTKLHETLTRQQEQFEALKTRARDYFAKNDEQAAEKRDHVHESVADEEIELELLRRKTETSEPTKGDS